METKTGDTSAFSLHSYFWWTSSGTLWRGREIHCAEALNPQSIEFTGRLISPYWRTRHKRQLVKVSVVVILGIIPLQRLHVRSEDFLKKKEKPFAWYVQTLTIDETKTTFHHLVVDAEVPWLLCGYQERQLSHKVRSSLFEWPTWRPIDWYQTVEFLWEN